MVQHRIHNIPLSPSPTLLHAFVLGSELLPSFPSVKPMDATTGFDPTQASPAPLQPKRHRRRLKTILRSIQMPLERGGRDTKKRIPPFNLHNRPKPGRRWSKRRIHNIIIISISHPAPCLCPRPRAPSPFSLSQAFGRDYRFRPSLSFPSPPPTQKASPPKSSPSVNYLQPPSNPKGVAA